MERKSSISTFPDERDVAPVMMSLYLASKKFFEERNMVPKIETNRDNNGDIIYISFENFDKDIMFDLYNEICRVRPHAWGHVEGFCDNLNPNKSHLDLHAELAYVPKR